MGRTAIVIFNLGGPDRPEAVRPFLFNLFNDPMILRQPAPVRWLLAKLIAMRRAPVARKIYNRIGGKSPILPLTRDQAEALQKILGPVDEIRVFVAMRHWHPLSEECIAEVKAYGADRVILLPLYPQYSTTTTGSFFEVWRAAAKKAGLAADTTAVCCYPAEAGFIDGLVRLAREGIEKAATHGTPRVLFSAHGLPEKFIQAGDPYRDQVERTVAATVEALAVDGLDYVICYQSRVGPVQWLRPYTDEEISRAGADGVPVVVVPVAFVTEHSETLVELDMEYADLAEESGVSAYIRVPTVGTDAMFIEGLANLVRRALASDAALICDHGGKLCRDTLAGCPFATIGARG
ncbi:MAG: ferrochelatase [Acidiferrobacterales bacterium]